LAIKKPPVTERFLAAFDDPAVFNCAGFNLLKVAQDAMIREVGQSGHRTYFNRPWPIIRAWLAVNRIRKRKEFSFIADDEKPVFALVPPRNVKGSDGKYRQQYMGKLFGTLPRRKVHMVYMTGSGGNEIAAEDRHENIVHSLAFEKPEADDIAVIKGLRECMIQLKQNTRFSAEELNHIQVGFNEFWLKYRAFRKYLGAFRFKKALIIPGYYTEHVIAALRYYKIKVIEIQHGVITPASHFYCYLDKIRPVADKALFADEVWLFGKFWKDQLLEGAEYRENQLKIIGDYFVRAEGTPNHSEALDSFSEKYPQWVLVGTQTKRHATFLRLVQQLSERYIHERKNTGIVVKLHPAEDPALYASLGELPNVMFAESSLENLYPRCKAYVNMYSNTLFEAARHRDVALFVLESEETKAFVEAIAATGVAQKLNPDEDPLSLPATENPADTQSFFAPEINISLIQHLMD
jgi:hypothetical protein